MLPAFWYAAQSAVSVWIILNVIKLYRLPQLDFHNLKCTITRVSFNTEIPAFFLRVCRCSYVLCTHIVQVESMVSDHLDISPSGTASSSATSQSIEHSRVQLFRFDATACSAGGSLAAPATQVDP